MKNAPFRLVFCVSLVSLSLAAIAQTQPGKQTPESSEIWEPVPPVVTPGITSANATGTTAPSDAVVLFDGKNTDEWVAANRDKTVAGPLQWPVNDGVLYSTKGFWARTKREFTDFQLHVEFKTPSTVEGDGQGRGNSGIFLQGRYELQILDNYNNPTYSNGMIGSVYKQAIPLANSCRKPGEWQTYDIVYQAPAFNKVGLMTNPAHVTVLLNGVLVQHHTAIRGTTAYIGYPKVQAHGAGPIMLQDHGNPVGFRNIWIREL
ncbi:3-keto-disaccharide hydrolase [Spirosoma arcticum]